MRRSSSLREQLDADALIVAPGVYDGITARLAEQAGFSALYMSGAMVSNSLGYPDYGLLTMTEMVERAGVIARASSVPVISDADTGYGNELNVTRTVREFEQRGAAGIHIEDQVSPKRCGHFDGKDVIGKEEFVSKIKAAVRAREDPGFVIIARTDALAVNGLNDAIERVNAALAVGADVAFVEGPRTMEEVEAVPQRVKGPCLLNIVQGGRTPVFDLNQVEQLGYRLAIVPGASLLPALLAMDTSLKELRQTRLVTPPPAGLDVRQISNRLGADQWNMVRKGLLT